MGVNECTVCYRHEIKFYGNYRKIYPDFSCSIQMMNFYFTENDLTLIPKDLFNLLKPVVLLNKRKTNRTDAERLTNM